MLFQNIGLLTQQGYTPKVDVATRGAFIEAIGDGLPMQAECYDGRGKLLTCGLVNAHSHAPMTLLRGYAENLALSDWLHQKVFPFEAQMRKEDIYFGALLAFAEMLRYGVVSTTEMYYFGDALAQAALDSGIKCNLSLGLTCFDGRGLEETPIQAENRELLNTWHNRQDGRIRLDLGLHAEYTSTPKVACQIAEYAAQTGLRLHIHLSETRTEVEQCRARHGGRTPPAYFASLGLFDSPVTAAHGVHLTEADIDCLAEKGVTVAHCPVSNLKLASGVCPVPKLLAAKVNVALGTDGAASNNHLNLMEEVKLFAILHKLTDPRNVTPQQALYAATRAGALSQGRQDCGLIAPGMRADLAVWDLSSPSLHPVHDMANNLVYAAQGADVCLTMVDGRVVYRDGRYPTLDLNAIEEKAQGRAQAILERLAEGGKQNA